TGLPLLGMGMDMPVAENPGALTRAQADTAPQIADPLSVTRKARKDVHQVQLGVSSRTPLGAGEVLASVYGGTRSLYNPLIPNIVGVERKQGGGSVRATA